jgi:hypothetical protein
VIKPTLRAKKAIVYINKVTREEYNLQCPHCKTINAGGFNRSVLRMECSYCDNPIDLIWGAD